MKQKLGHKLALGALAVLMVGGLAMESAQAAWRPCHNNQPRIFRDMPRSVAQQRLINVRQRQLAKACFWQTRRQARFAPHSWYNHHNPPNRRFRW